MSGQYETGIMYYEKAANLDPQYLENLKALSLAHFALENSAEYEKYFVKSENIKIREDCRKNEKIKKIKSLW